MAAIQGFYKVKNVRKYKGNPTKVIYRSSWELKLMGILDDSPDILEWSSEGVIIPYRIGGRVRRYYPDFWVKKQVGSITEQWIIEVKPSKQTKAPKVQKRRTKSYLYEVKTWAVNKAKWAAAEKYCAKRGWKFKKFTEHELGIKGY